MRGYEDVPIDWSPVSVTEQGVSLQYIIPGRPVQKGNMKAGRWGGIHDATKGLGDWSAMVSHQAQAAMNGAWRRREAIRAGQVCPQGQAARIVLDVITDAVMIDVTFVMPRPKTTRIQGVLWNLSKGPTPPHTKAPDLDKLVRSIGDAMTSIVYADDSQIIEMHVRKRYAELGETPGALIRVSTGTGKDW